MLAKEAVAGVVVVALLGGCFTTQHTIPVSEAARLSTGVVSTRKGNTKLGAHYTVELVPYLDEVLVRRGDTLRSIPATTDPAPSGSELVPPLEGPVSGAWAGKNLVLRGPKNTLIISPWSVMELKVVEPHPVKTALVWSAVTVGGLAVVAGIVAAIIYGTSGGLNLGSFPKL